MPVHNFLATDPRAMEVAESGSSAGYDAGPPWVFKGSALYQLHLVKAETARYFIPKEFRLVEAFGYTLGGLFLAHYDDSPVGRFDELVVIAGIVWNIPTSCAWAARVLVNSHEACRHGRKDIGLPSQVATFSKKIEAISEKPGSKYNGFLNMMGMYSDVHKMKNHMEIQVEEMYGPSATAFCNINLQASVPESKVEREWMGPIIRMSLPSFSGNTEHNPHLLKYSCQIECRVRPVEPVKISELRGLPESDYQDPSYGRQKTGGSAENDARNQSISILLSKPIMALEFNFMKLQVGAPRVLVHRSSPKKKIEDS